MGPWCYLGILSVMEGKVVNCSSVGLDRTESLGKGVYKLLNPSTGKALKKVVNVCRLKPYYSRKSHFSDSSVFQTCSSSDETCSPIAVRHYRSKRIAISSADDDCIESSHYSQVKLESEQWLAMKLE